METAMLASQDYQCPYCGEVAQALLDLSGGDQQYIEDCPVCCRPIEFELQTDGQDWVLHTHRDDD
jgi:transcription elongation factor Elf1